MPLGDLPINRNAAPQQFDSEPLPKGRYPGKIVKATLKEASTGAQVLALEAEFEKGRKAWTTLTLIKSSGEENMPGVGLLSALATACGLDAIPKDENQLLGISIVIKLDVEAAQGGYAAKNVMKAFYPAESAGKQAIARKLEKAAANTPPPVVAADADEFDIPF